MASVVLGPRWKVRTRSAACAGSLVLGHVCFGICVQACLLFSVVNLQSLNTKGRKMVTIVDPHIKVDSSYHVYQDGSNKGFFVKKADGSEFQVSLSQ